jgi:hypothetical protein
MQSSNATNRDASTSGEKIEFRKDFLESLTVKDLLAHLVQLSPPSTNNNQNNAPNSNKSPIPSSSNAEQNLICKEKSMQTSRSIPDNDQFTALNSDESPMPLMSGANGASMSEQKSKHSGNKASDGRNAKNPLAGFAQPPQPIPGNDKGTAPNFDENPTSLSSDAKRAEGKLAPSRNKDSDGKSFRKRMGNAVKGFRALFRQEQKGF